MSFRKHKKRNRAVVVRIRAGQRVLVVAERSRRTSSNSNGSGRSSRIGSNNNYSNVFYSNSSRRTRNCGEY